MGTYKRSSRKLSPRERGASFRSISIGAGAGVSLTLPSILDENKRIKSNDKKYNKTKATAYGWVSYSTLFLSLVCGGLFSFYHIVVKKKTVVMADGLSLPKSDRPFLASGEDGSLFSRVYYRANATHCFGELKEQKGEPDSDDEEEEDDDDDDDDDDGALNTEWLRIPTFADGALNTEWLRIPTFADGVSAGPIIDCAPNDDVSCDLEKALSDLEVIQSLRGGQSFQFFLPHQDLGVHDVIQLTRMRKSSSTGVVFLDDNHLAIVSYGMKRIYIYQYDFNMGGSKSARLLASVNTAGNPDLMHVDLKRKMFVVSLFKEGAQQLFKYDLEKKSLEAIKVVNAFGAKVENQWCHEAAFHPSDTSSIIAAGSSNMKQEENLMISIFDYEHERVIAQYLMMANDEKEICNLICYKIF